MSDGHVSIIPMAVAVEAARKAVMSQHGVSLLATAHLGMRIADNLEARGLTPDELRAVGAWCRASANWKSAPPQTVVRHG